MGVRDGRERELGVQIVLGQIGGHVAYLRCLRGCLGARGPRLALQLHHAAVRRSLMDRKEMEGDGRYARAGKK